MTFQNVIDQAQRILADTDAQRYPETDLLQYALEAHRTAAALLPPEAVPPIWRKTNYDVAIGKTAYVVPQDLLLISAARKYTTTEGGVSVHVHIIPQESERLFSDNSFFETSTNFQVLVFQDNYLVLRPSPTAAVTRGLEVHYQAKPAGSAVGDTLQVPDAAGDAMGWYVAAMALLSDQDREGYTANMTVFSERMQLLAQRYAAPVTARRGGIP